MNSIWKLAIAAALSFTSAALAFAQEADHEAHHPASSQVAQSPSESAHAGGDVAGQTVDGEIRKVDKDAGKITIRHGELKNLGMPPMTMVFRVKEPGMLDQVKAGDKVSFIAEKAGGLLTVTQLTLRN